MRNQKREAYRLECEESGFWLRWKIDSQKDIFLFYEEAQGIAILGKTLTIELNDKRFVPIEFEEEQIKIFVGKTAKNTSQNKEQF